MELGQNNSWHHGAQLWIVRLSALRFFGVFTFPALQAGLGKLLGLRPGDHSKLTLSGFKGNGPAVCLAQPNGLGSIHDDRMRSAIGPAVCLAQPIALGRINDDRMRRANGPQIP